MVGLVLGTRLPAYVTARLCIFTYMNIASSATADLRHSPHNLKTDKLYHYQPFNQTLERRLFQRFNLGELSRTSEPQERVPSLLTVESSARRNVNGSCLFKDSFTHSRHIRSAPNVFMALRGPVKPRTIRPTPQSRHCT